MPNDYIHSCILLLVVCTLLFLPDGVTAAGAAKQPCAQMAPQARSSWQRIRPQATTSSTSRVVRSRAHTTQTFAHRRFSRGKPTQLVSPSMKSWRATVCCRGIRALTASSARIIEYSCPTAAWTCSCSTQIHMTEGCSFAAGISSSESKLTYSK